jgi:cob(I)alamin adenosyltransferase
LLNWIAELQGASLNKPEKKSPRLGLVQVFTGAGKGKTTASLGTVLRAAGHSFKTLVIFFVKGDSSDGEFNTLPKLPGVQVAKFGLRKWIRDPKNVTPEEVAEAKKALDAAYRAAVSGDYDIIVCDEINIAVHFKLITAGDVLKLIRDKAPNTELILTGRNADESIIGAADLVTEMKAIKHPYDKGISAREGIEY